MKIYHFITEHNQEYIVDAIIFNTPVNKKKIDPGFRQKQTAPFSEITMPEEFDRSKNKMIVLTMG
jgi:hypothetical protein